MTSPRPLNVASYTELSGHGANFLFLHAHIHSENIGRTKITSSYFGIVCGIPKYTFSVNMKL